MKIESIVEQSRTRLAIAGDCRMADVPALDAALRALLATPPAAVAIDFGAAAGFDIGPAWLVRRAIAELERRGTRVEFEGRLPAHFDYLDRLPPDVPAAAVPDGTNPAIRSLAGLGRRIEQRAGTWYESVLFGGRLLETAGRKWRRPAGLRLPSVVRHVYETGVRAIPVVAMIAFLISVIAAYIGAQQLRPFGAEIFTVDLVAIGVLRELGVLLTAIMVAGRTGSAYAAELGVMKLNDEVDALESMGLDPIELLVLPRVLGLVIAMPLLTVVADFMGLAGGAVLTRYLFELPWPQFVTRLDDAIANTTFWAGMIKAPVFGLVIALTGTLRGLQVRESSRELGRLTTVAVVQSIFLVILVDALFAMLYLEIDF